MIQGTAMKVLLTGGAGFIGSHIVDLLIQAGHETVIVDNLWKYGGGKLENIIPRASFYQMDIRDPALSHGLRKSSRMSFII
jgi:UDP-glucose 4-epimerase